MKRLTHQLRRRLLSWADLASKRVQGEAPTLVVLGAAVGVISGLAAVALVELVRAVNSLVWKGQLGLRDVVPEDVLAHGEPPAWYHEPWLVVPAGLVITVVIARRLSRDAEGHGVTEVMDAVARKGGLIRARVGLTKLICSSINIGTGGSVGKEGPIAQIGASFGSALAQLLALRGRHMRTLVGCGAAAGVAAVFNAPIAGVLFALEIVIGAYNLSAFAPVLIASVAGAVTSRRFMGSKPAFDIPDSLREGLTIVSPWEFGAYVVLGLVMGVASIVFIRTLYAVEDRAASWSAPPWLKAALAGLGVGAAGLLLPEVLGEGHHAMTQTLLADATSMSWTLLLLLASAKLLATVVTLAGGGSGGVFTPSLYVGAMLGGAFGQGVAALFPGQVGPQGAYALAGMAALLAGTAHAPMTAILLLFEMSDNYLLILPLMTVSVVATTVAQRLLPDSIYTLSLSRRGVLLRDREDTALLKRLRVADAMRPAVEALPDTTTFDRIVRRLMLTDHHDLPVVDSEQRYLGAVSFLDVKEFLRDEHLDQLLLARDCVRQVTVLEPSTTLLDALEAFEEEELDEIPVVVEQRLMGALRRDDVLRTYRRALMAETGGKA